MASAKFTSWIVHLNKCTILYLILPRHLLSIICIPLISFPSSLCVIIICKHVWEQIFIYSSSICRQNDSASAPVPPLDGYYHCPVSSKYAAAYWFCLLLRVLCKSSAAPLSTNCTPSSPLDTKQREYDGGRSCIFIKDTVLLVCCCGVINWARATQPMFRVINCQQPSACFIPPRKTKKEAFCIFFLALKKTSSAHVFFSSWVCDDISLNHGYTAIKYRCHLPCCNCFLSESNQSS